MDNEVVVISGIVLCCSLLLLNKTRRVRQFKTRAINRSRRKYGFYTRYFVPMKENDPDQFFKYTRLNVAAFEKLLDLLRPHLVPRRKLGDYISPEERLAVTLHYFSQGSSMQSVAWTYHMGHSTVHKIIKNTAKAIWVVLSEKYLRNPSTENEWRKIAEGFQNKWNFPNCIGALDGKHIQIQAPAKSGSMFFNYKKTFSIVLLACCDANYLFTLIDIGAYGSESDGGIFKNSIFGNMIEQSQLNIPAPSKLPNSSIMHPYTIVADEAFPLRTFIMRPYPGRNLTPSNRIFNYRLSRARRVIENTFGIMVNRWRLMRVMITAKVDNIDTFVKAIVCLHNYAMKESSTANDVSYCPPGFVDSDESMGTWREDGEPLRSVGRLSTNRAANVLYTVRDNLRNYFCSPAGAIPWQNKVLEDGFCLSVDN